MIIQKKQQYYSQFVSSKSGYARDVQKVLKTTWYFLGIPVYSSSEIISST